MSAKQKEKKRKKKTKGSVCFKTSEGQGTAWKSGGNSAVRPESVNVETVTVDVVAHQN